MGGASGRSVLALAAMPLVALAAGCAGAPVTPAGARPGGGEPVTAVAGTRPGEAVPPGTQPAETPASGRSLPASPPILSGDLDAGVLMPRAKPDDAEVVNVAGFSVRKSHLYDRLLEINPRGTRREVDWIVFDILLAVQARKHAVFVDVEEIDQTVAKAEKILEDRVKADWGGRITLDDFLIKNRGVTRKYYRALARRQRARELLRYYVVRYLASLEDRVKVRIILHRDRSTIESILQKVNEGADFRSLALRESEHETKRRGGLLPPYSRSSTAKFVKPAFELQPGEVSKILTLESEGVQHYYLLYCVERLPGEKLPFKELKAKLDKERAGNPLTEEEMLDLYVRLRDASEALPNGVQKR